MLRACLLLALFGGVRSFAATPGFHKALPAIGASLEPTMRCPVSRPPMPTMSVRRSGGAIMAAAASVESGSRGISLLGVAVFVWAMTIGVFVSIPMTLAAWILGPVVDKPRRLVSRMGNFWGRIALLPIIKSVRVVGRNNLPPDSSPCLVLVNHASQLDIPASAWIGRAVKYIAKAELAKYPVIGWKMKLAKDLLIARSSRASQAALLKEARANFKAGNSVLAFPEGARSVDGTLKPFKRGPFRMAMEANVPIVPVTLKGTHDMWPTRSTFPVRRGTLEVFIHEPIETAGAVEDELVEQTRAAIQSGLE